MGQVNPSRSSMNWEEELQHLMDYPLLTQS